MAKITVKYAAVYKEQQVTPAEFDLVYSLYGMAEKIKAIKFIRQQYQLSLKEAKDVCDAIGENQERAY